MVARHRTECTSHAAAHAGLPAVENGVVADDMGPDVFLRPPDLQGFQDHLVVYDGPVLGGLIVPCVMACRPVLPQGDPRTF